MTETLERIERHHRSVAQRTIGSLVLYAGFIGASLMSAVQFRALEDPVTMASIVLVVAAFLVLPRNYVPGILQHKAETETEELKLEELRRFERFGLFVRVAYVIGAVLTLLIVPRMAAG